ncbi:MAG: DEAD/DEAH box helicase family protein, partial [Atopobiaceae bacterium]|nr:DEAD/DEAH box helicase family protein [Atopobiaceae bacterium]
AHGTRHDDPRDGARPSAGSRGLGQSVESLEQSLESISRGELEHPGWEASREALDTTIEGGTERIEQAVAALGEDGLAEAEEIAYTTLNVGNPIESALVDSLSALGLSGGEHILLDNCGTTLVRSEAISNCDIAVLERDWRLEESLDDMENANVREGSSRTSSFPAAAFHAAFVRCDPNDPAESLHAAVRGVADGGVIVAVAPADLIFGTTETTRHAFQDMIPLSSTRVTAPDGEVAVIVGRRSTGSRHETLESMQRRDLTFSPVEELQGALATALREDIAACTEGAIAQHAQVTGTALSLPLPSYQDALTYELAADGGIWLCDMRGVAENVAAGGTRKARRMRGAIELSGMVESLLAFEGSQEASEAEVAQRVDALSRRYMEYVSDFGRLNDNGVMRELSTMTRVGYVLQHLEVVDEHGRYRSDGAILGGRVAWPPNDVAEVVDDVDTALSMSLARLGRFDLTSIAVFLGVDEEAAMERLEGKVLFDPDTNELVAAEDYLSGYIGVKLDHVRELIAALTTDREQAALGTWRMRMNLEPQVEQREERLLNQRLGEFLRSDTWSVLTGRSKVVSLDVVSNIEMARVFRGGAWIAGVLLRRLMREASPDAWDPMTARSAREGFNYIASRTLAWYSHSFDDFELFSELSDCAAIDDDLMKEFLTVYCRRSRDSVFTLRQLVSLAYPSEETAQSNDATIERAISAMREHPEAVEWMLYCHRNFDERNIQNRAMFEAFSARREDSIHLEVDSDRLAYLQDLEQRLVDALPARLEKKDIAARLGSPWIPPSVYLDFARDRLISDRATSASKRDISFTLDPELKSWDVKYSDRAVKQEAVARYAIIDNEANDASAFRVLSNAMRGIPTVVTRTVLEGDHTRQVTDEELTLLAADKRATLESDFVDWLWSDPDRSEVLVDLYNEVMNRHVGRQYDGSYLTFPDSSDEVELQSHQRDAVARVLRSPEGSLLAHAVGAGKTFEGIAATHEAKRLGKCTKPLVAVPNSVVGQWSREWSRVYPHDRVLVMDDRVGRNARSRERFWDVAQSGEWDAVIVPQSQFDLLGLSPEARLATIDEEIRHYENLALTNPGPESTRRRRASLIEANLRRLRNERESLAETSGPYFDAMGFDMLVVDEAHRYKHLGVRTAMSVSGIDPKPSKMSQNLMRLCDHLRSIDKGSNIVFLTGTPVTNSIAELFVMQSYLAPKALDELGVGSFDAWAATFGQIHREVEIKPEGGLQTKDRFSRFTNLPELMS